jgi:hypothetical protein
MALYWLNEVRPLRYSSWSLTKVPGPVKRGSEPAGAPPAKSPMTSRC